MLFLLGCSTNSHRNISKEEIAITHKDIKQAAQYLADNLCEPGKKVCLGKIQEESPSQHPLVQALLDELEVSIAGRMDLLERKRLQEIIDQQKLQTSDFFQQENLAKIGDFARVDYMILGEIHERTMDYDVLLKMVCMQSAIVKKAAKTNFSKDKIPAYIIREIARLELISKGYKDLAQGKKGEILSYFARPYSAQGIPNTQEDPLSMKFKAEKKKQDKITLLKPGETLEQNDRYRFHIMLNKSAYLYSIALDSQGRVSPIFPYGTQGILGQNFTNPLQANKKYQFPPQESPEGWFTVKDTSGIGQIGIILSLKPMPDLEKLLEESTTSQDNSSIQIQAPLLGNEDDIPRNSKSIFSPTLQETNVSTFSETLKLPFWYSLQEKYIRN